MKTCRIFYIEGRLRDTPPDNGTEIIELPGTDRGGFSIHIQLNSIDISLDSKNLKTFFFNMNSNLIETTLVVRKDAYMNLQVNAKPRLFGYSQKD